MRIYPLTFLLLASVSMVSFIQPLNEETGYSIVKKMFDRTAQIKSLKYTITKEERIDGKLTRQVSQTKMEKEPFRAYLRQSFPKDGMEILYVDGENNNKALINPNGFPWLNLKLNPRDGIMRNDQHHTIFQSGFDFVVSILEYLSAKYNSEIENLIRLEGIVTNGNKECYSISMFNPHFKYIDYTVTKNETLEDIATRYKLSAYMILELNKSIKNYEDIEAGQVIKIPNTYSPRMLLLVDKENLIPIKMEVYDQHGLFEKYEYSDVVIDPEIAEEEFTSEYPEYGF